MGKTVFIVLMGVGILALWCCKKDASLTQISAPGFVAGPCSHMVKRIVTGGFYIDHAYTYDMQNRMIYDSAGNKMNVAYVYAPGVVYEIANGTDTTVAHLNAMGLVDTLAGYTNYYNSLGQMIYSVDIFNRADSTAYIWRNGDMIEVEYFDGYFQTDFIWYTYSTDTDTRNFGRPFLGKTSVHTVIQQTSVHRGTESMINMFDTCHRLGQVVSTYPGATQNGYTEYTYY